MRLTGHVENGKIQLDNPGALPEGATISIEVIEVRTPRTLYERFESIIGTVSDLPADMAVNHEHYTYGRPKR